MPNTIFDRPDLSAFTRLDDLGLEVTGQRIEPDHAVLACRITGADRWCRRCGCQGISRGTVVRRLAYEPCGWRPTILHVSVRRYRRPECAQVWRQDVGQAADPRAKVSRAAVRWALTGVCVMGLLPVVCGACTQMRCLGQELRVDVDVVRSSTHVRIVKPAQRSVSAPVPVVADHLSGGVRVVSLLAHGILIRILRGIRIDERTGVGGSIARAVVPRILGV